GHSFGGGPTMEAVLLAPQRVRSLVLADAAIGLDAKASGGGGAALVLRARPLRNALVASTVTNPLLTRRLLTMFVANPGAVTQARVQVLQAPLVVQGATDAFGDWLLDFLTSREVALSAHADAYRALALPTLVIWGDRDTTTPLAQGQRLAKPDRGGGAGGHAGDRAHAADRGRRPIQSAPAHVSPEVVPVASLAQVGVGRNAPLRPP